MHDPFVRATLLYIIFGTLAVAGSIILIWHRRRAYWRKRRQAGDSRAKQRELASKRKLR
ncbi:hypothetical protein [Sphingomonas soli]|uniref:hypothetical protein n=1 Tax=Sphingomonas soli TaxID=266127 RepID=UPI0012EE7BAF|nr:hypothetical protein [Sphingomonas soli]